MRSASRLLLACAIGLSPVPAIAQMENPAPRNAPPNMMNDLFLCLEIADADDRLACFDREAENLKRTQERQGLVVVDRVRVAASQRDFFGFNGPPVPVGRGAEEKGELNEVATTIASFTLDRSGKVRFSTKEGSVWLQTDDVPILGRVEQGDPVTIERAALGSYKAKVGDRRAFRVERTK